MRSWMIAFSLGILLGGIIPGLPASNFLPLFFIPTILGFRFSACRLLGAYCIGLFWVLNWATNSLEQLLPAELERKDFWVRGSIASLPELNRLNSQFIFKVEESCLKPLASCDFSNELLQDQLIQLSIYQELALSPGQRWQFKVRLKRPHGFANPGGFDYEAWLWQKQIRASGYVRSDEANLLYEDKAGHSFISLRSQFRQKLDQLFPDEGLKHLNLIKALSIGDRQGITDEEWSLFSATGTNHLMIISGMHVGFIVLMFYHLSKLSLKRIGRLALYLSIPRIAAFMAVIAAYFYAGMAGFALPAQRAFIMIAAFMLAQCCCRHSSVINSYWLALALVLMINPLSPVSSGFWLSFIAVAVLVFFVNQPDRQQSPGLIKLVLMFRTQLFIFLGLLPFMLLFFQQSSISAPLINLVAIPFLTLLIVPLCLLILLLSYFSTELVIYFSFCAERLLEFFLSMLELINQHWPQALLKLPALAFWQWLMLLLAISLMLLGLTGTKNFRFLILALICCIPVLFVRGNKLDLNEFQLDVLDVGQGLALVIRTRQHVMLYDLGPAYSDSFNAGEGIVLPFLRSQNINHVDKVIVSHGDNDHSGGLSPVLLAYPAAEYLASDLKPFSSQHNYSSCSEGQYWNWDGVDFEILHPDKESDNRYNSNNSSCVLLISNANHSVLLTGDIEAQVERRLLRAGSNINAEILIAPHHGSKTSSHKRFIEAVSPDYVVFSSGYLNQFQHPHPDIVNLYTNSGTISLNTAETGTISWKIGMNEDLQEAVLYRQANKRFWRVLP